MWGGSFYFFVVKLDNNRTIAYNNANETRPASQRCALGRVFCCKIEGKAMPTSTQTKPFKNYDEQISLLKERGLIITDDAYARDILKRMNYYRFSAYSLTLRENDRFFPEVALQDVVALYDFDQEFRNIIFKYGTIAETVARAYIAYYHARQYGPIGYLNNQNFEDEHRHATFLGTLNHEISRSKEPFITHHKKDKQGVYPLWVAIEEMTFGTLSLFYKNMLEADRNCIAREYYGRKSAYIENYLQCAVVARNIAAHGGRFYNRVRLSPAVKLPLPMRRSNVNNESPFAYFYAIYELLPDDEKFGLIRAVEKLFEKYPTAELSKMGFQCHWKALLNVPDDLERAND